MDLGTLIPQLFYDLIGRIVPGAVILGICAVAFVGDEKIQSYVASGNGKIVETTIPTAFIFFSLLLISYVLGALLGGLWFFISPAVLGKKLKTGVKGVYEKTTEEIKDKVELNVKEYPGSVSFMYDYIQLRCPKAGARIAKLRAEQHMSGVLIVGFIIIVILNAIFSFSKYNKLSFWMIMFICLTGAISATLLARHLEDRSGNALCNYWLLAASGIVEGGSTRDSNK